MPSIKEITLTIAWILLGTGLSNTTGNSLDPAPGRSPGPPRDNFNIFAETKKTTPTFVDDQFSDINYSHEVEADRRTSTILTTVEPPAQLKQQQVNLYTTTSETMTGTATITKEKVAVGDTPIVTLQHISSSSLSSPSSFPSSSQQQQQQHQLPCNKKHGRTKEKEPDFIKADDKIVRISNDDVDDAVQFDVMHDVFDTTPTTTNLVAGIVYKGKHIVFVSRYVYWIGSLSTFPFPSLAFYINLIIYTTV